MKIGLGYFKHFSGYVYEGIFVKGHPANAPSKLTISTDEFNQNDRLKVHEGKPFRITVKSKNNNDELFLGKCLSTKTNFILKNSNKLTCLYLRGWKKYTNQVGSQIGHS